MALYNDHHLQWISKNSFTSELYWPEAFHLSSHTSMVINWPNAFFYLRKLNITFFYLISTITKMIRKEGNKLFSMEIAWVK